MMQISVTRDFWSQVERARTKHHPGKLPALMDLPPGFIEEPGAWYVRFLKIERRRYLFLLHPATGMYFAVAGLRKVDLADPVKLVSTWLERGLLAMGLGKEKVASYLEGQEYEFYNGGDRKQVAAGNVLFRDAWVTGFDQARPVRQELALTTLYWQLYSGLRRHYQSLDPVLNLVAGIFLSEQERAGVEVKWGYATQNTARLADGRPALPVPGITVEVELVTNAEIFGMPHGDAQLKKSLPSVKRILQVPLDSTFFHLNQAIQASLGLFAYHLYNFLPAVAADAKKPLLEIYCWDAPPEFPSIFDDPADRSGKSRIKQVADIAISLREVLQLTDLIYYMYDFGDGWAYSIKLGQQVELAGFTCQLLGGTGDPPPVDVGGLYSWLDFLDAVAKPDSEEGQDLLAWSKIVHWTPFDLAKIQERLAGLDYIDAEYWAGKLEPVDLEF